SHDCYRYFSCSGMSDDEIIVLSDDDGPSSTVRGARPEMPITLGLSPCRPIAKRSCSPEVLSLSGPSSPLRARNTVGSPAAKQPRIDLPSTSLSNDDIDDIFDDPMFGGRGVRKFPAVAAKAASEGDEKKKRKDKGEADEERKRKQEERDQKKQARDEKKATEAKEKKQKAIEREISASQKSKAEEYLYCRVGRGAIDMIPGLDAALRVLMADRKIDTQLEIKSSLETRVEWWRKAIEAVQLEIGGGVERVESMIQEPVEVIVMDAAALAVVIKAAALEQHVVKLRSSLGVSNALLILLVHGKLNVKDSELDAQAVALHERHRTQIREVHTANEAALFFCQMHRATARLHMKRSERIITDVTKGQRERVGLVADWWGKMLAMVPRLSGIYARALTAAFPNPLAIMDRIEKEGQDAVESNLAAIRTDIGHRIGPKRARKVIELLTTEDGLELFT
ncbi:hypothetical protein PENTCL1PPCAC_20115, partial [Pristionchus entomophagus]